MVFKFDNAHHLAIHQNGTVGFLRVGLVLLLGNQVVVGRRVERVAQHLHKQFAQEALLKLFFLALADIFLNIRVQKVLLVLQPSLCHSLLRCGIGVFFDNIFLKQHCNGF